MKRGIFFVVDDRLALIACILAKKLSVSLGCDIHVFVEGGEPFVTGIESKNIFVHFNELYKFLPKGLPCSKKWPEIVYLRIFAPFLLKEYDRLIYLDADIIPLRMGEQMWDVELDGALGAVSDFAVLERSPVEGVTKLEWLKSIGVNSGRYFNSGVILIDVPRWCRIDFSERLNIYTVEYGHFIKMFDQDFLNWLFQDQWVDLGPSWNFQASVFGYGVEYLCQPIFLHYSKPEKPWLGQYDQRIVDLDHAGAKKLAHLASTYHLDISHLVRKKRINVFSHLKYFSRAKLSTLGIVTKKEKRLRTVWEENRNIVMNYIFSKASDFGVVKDEKAVETALSFRPVFDGKALRSPLSPQLRHYLGV